MFVNIRNLNYVPTLSLRRAEITGLEKLPPETKNIIQPLFLFAPWPNARTIERSINRIEEAFGERPFFIDIDQYYQPSEKLDEEVQKFWEKLRYRDSGYETWTNFVINNLPNASPCIQFFAPETTLTDIKTQIHVFQKAGRSFAVRFEFCRLPSPNLITEIIKILTERGTADYAIILDSGWIRDNDTQSLRLKMQNFITDQLRILPETVPIIVSYTTIPKFYHNITGTKNIPFDNRETRAELIKNTNKLIIYGDWASTRPRSCERASLPKPRVDVALKNSWLVARNKESDWGYKQDAEHISQDTRWTEIETWPLWGILKVKETIKNPSEGIHSAHTNTAARVNMHLHMQAFYEDGHYPSLSPEEELGDEY